MTKRIFVVEDQEDNRRIIRDPPVERRHKVLDIDPEHPGYAAYHSTPAPMIRRSSRRAS